MIVALIGPTASGKSKLAVSLAKKIDGEIINGDAFQVYRDFRISTARPSEEEMEGVPHHLFGFLPSNITYDTHQYQKDAREAIAEVISRGKTPIVVGGSGLYIRSALYDYDLALDTTGVDMSPYSDMSDTELHSELEKLDPTEAKKIPYQNRRRVLRSIEICLAAGESKTSLLSKQNHSPIFETAFYRLSPNREDLFRNIEKRTEKMFSDGIVNEVLPKISNVTEIKGAYQAIGVKEFFAYRDKKATLEETKEAIILDTKHYVKRQETFFRHQFDAKIVTDLKEIIDDLENR